MRAAHVQANPVAGERVWRQWMRGFGQHVRRVREFLGLSQGRLAKMAGVSQGAVSRFEAGRGLNAPFIIILRMNMALARALRTMDPALLTEDVHRFLRHMEFLRLPTDPGAPPLPGGIALTHERGLEDVIRLYRRLPAASRRAFAAAMQAFATTSAPELGAPRAGPERVAPR